MKKGTLAALLVTWVILSMGSITVTSAVLPNEKAEEAVSRARSAIEGTPANDKAIKFVFYAKPPWAGQPGGPGGAKEEGKGYELLRGGVKLGETPASYSINPAGSGVGEDATVSAIVVAFETWDDEVKETELFNAPILTENSGTLRNSENVISWAYIEDSNVIAQCTIWFYVNTKEIIEFDIVFNTQQPWGIDLDGEENGYVLTDAFDIQNIATHESGYTLHLGDLYEDGYSEMTMYGYSRIGEVKKRSLEWGDKNGVHKLYGA